MMRTIAALAGALLTAACATTPPLPAAPAPTFDPLVFFAGHTEGEGRLPIVAHHAVAVRVHGDGRIGPDGALLLDQTVARSGTAPTRRSWRIRAIGGGRYAGTLSDAAGPVTGETTGARLHLRFAMKGGLRTDQWIDLAPDGQSALNRLTVRKLGIVVARLTETIRRTR